MDLLVCTIIEQSWPTFKDTLKENLNINRFICTCIRYGRKEKEKYVMNFFLQSITSYMYSIWIFLLK